MVSRGGMGRTRGTITVARMGIQLVWRIRGRSMAVGLMRKKSGIGKPIKLPPAPTPCPTW